MKNSEIISAGKLGEKSMKIPPFYTGGCIMDWELRHNVNPIMSGVVDTP